MKPMNFPERKRQRQIRAFERAIEIGDEVTVENLTGKIPSHSLRDIRTKKYRGPK